MESIDKKQHLLNSSGSDEVAPVEDEQLKPLESNKVLKSFDSIESEHNEPDSSNLIKNSKYLGIVYGIISVVCFTLNYTFCKMAYFHNTKLNGFDYLLVRSIAMNMTCFIDVYRLNVNIFDVKEGYKLILFFRCIAGAIAMPLMSCGLKFIPISKANLIFNLNPLIIAVAAYFVLKEKITILNVYALIGAFVGVILFNIHKNETKDVSDLYYVGILMMLFTCICFTVITLLTRMFNRENHYALLPIYFAITTCLESFILFLIQLILNITVYHFSEFSYYDFTLFFLSGIFYYCGQVTRSLALKYEKASYIAPFNYLQVVALLICDLTLFGYVFVLLDYIGAVITIVCVLIPVIRDIYSEKKQ